MLRESAPLQLPAAGDGIIGLALLQQMTLSTDVRGRRLWVQRNGRAAPPERYRMTGLWVDDHGGQVVVAEVSPASPAAEAGVRVGDVIEGVSLDGFLRAAGGPPGTRVPIRLRRGGETIATTLVLRAYL